MWRYVITSQQRCGHWAAGSCLTPHANLGDIPKTNSLLKQTCNYFAGLLGFVEQNVCEICEPRPATLGGTDGSNTAPEHGFSLTALTDDSPKGITGITMDLRIKTTTRGMAQLVNRTGPQFWFMIPAITHRSIFFGWIWVNLNQHSHHNGGGHSVEIKHD